MAYTFRFQVVENVTRASAGISAAFARMANHARQFARGVDTSAHSMDNLEKESRQTDAAVNRVFNASNASRFEASVGRIGHGFDFIRNTVAALGVGMVVKDVTSFGDRMFTANALTAGITRNVKSLGQAQQQALALSNLTGDSYLHSYEGLSKMLTVADGNVEKASQLTKIGAALAALNPAEGFEGALFALKELEGADTMSLRERFNIKVPTQEEAKKIAARDGRTVQQVMFDSLQQYLDSNYGGGKAGAGVEYLLSIRANTISGQMGRVANQFRNIFTPMLLPFLEKAQVFLKGTAEWVGKNTDNIRNWGVGIAQIAMRAAAVYGVFLSIRTVGAVWGILVGGISDTARALYRVGFFASWGIGRMRILALTTWQWASAAVLATGKAIRSIGLYLYNLFVVNAVQNRLIFSFAWARIVAGFSAMFAGARAYAAALTWAGVQQRLLAAWGGIRAAFASFITMALPAMWTWVSTLNFATIGQWLLNTAMLANPVGLVIAGVLGLAAAFTGLFKLIDTLFPGFFSGVKEWFGKAWDWIYNTFIAPVVKFFKWLADMTGISAAFDMTAVTVPDTTAQDNQAAADMEAQNKALFEKLGLTEGKGKGIKGFGAGAGSGAGIGMNDKLNSISGGGREGVKNININIGKQIENLVFQDVKGLPDIKSLIRRTVEQVLLDAVNEVNYSN